jgi:hypothetical protein
MTLPGAGQTTDDEKVAERIWRTVAARAANGQRPARDTEACGDTSRETLRRTVRSVKRVAAAGDWH